MSGWIAVTRRFENFKTNLEYTKRQNQEGMRHSLSVLEPLNRHYYNADSCSGNGGWVGSWSKETKIRPPGDIDLYFELPVSLYERYEQRTGNRQSAILQEVKGILSTTFPSTEIKGDGPCSRS